MPVGLGNKIFSDEWHQYKNDINICHKNPFYGEYTFHYWLWKNEKIQFNDWVGFCQYRKFWQKDNFLSDLETFDKFKSQCNEISISDILNQRTNNNPSTNNFDF